MGASALWAGLIFLLAFLVQLIGMTRQVNAYDECLELFAAVRVMHGDLPYRDFWTMYGPAQFYIIAGLFKVFGTSVLVARLYHAFAGACVIAFLFVLLRNLISLSLSVSATVLALIWMTGVTDLSYEFPTYPALALTFASVLLLLPFLEERNRRFYLFLSGAFVGCVTLFRHDFGFYVFLCELLIIACRGLSFPNQREYVRAIAKNVRPMALYLAGLALILIPASIVLLVHVPAHDLYFDLIFVPARIYPKVRALPFPGFKFLFRSIRLRDWINVQQAIDYFPGTVALTSILYILQTGRVRGKEAVPGRRLHLLLTILLVFMTIKGLVRVSPIQLIQAIVLAIALLAVLVERVNSRQRVLVFLLACCFAIAALPTMLDAKVVFERSSANLRNLVGSQPDNYPGAPGGLFKDACRAQPGLERIRCFYIAPYEVQAIQYIQAHTSSSDRIYVGSTRHDRLWLNDLSFYFVSKRLSGTKWHDLHPGIETTADIQSEMIEDLKKSQTRYVILESTWDDFEEPNQSRVSSGVTLLDKFIAQNYKPAASFGPISILQHD